MPNANAIADMALENWVEMRDKVSDLRFLFRKKLEAKIEDLYPDIFKSRYGLIAYTTTSYSVAQEAGLIQNKILDELMLKRSNLEEISESEIEASLKKYWSEFSHIKGLDLKHFE